MLTTLTPGHRVYSVAALLMSLPGAWSQQLCKVWSKPLASVCFYGLVINL